MKDLFEEDKTVYDTDNINPTIPSVYDLDYDDARL